MLSPEEQIAEMALAAVSGFAERMVDWMQYLVSEPYPPASYPLDAPNKRTGKLQAGIHVLEISQQGYVWQWVIESSVFYTGYLNYGTEIMIKRPFMDMALDKMEEMAAEQLQAEFSGESPGVIAT